MQLSKNSKSKKFGPKSLNLPYFNGLFFSLDLIVVKLWQAISCLLSREIEPGTKAEHMFLDFGE